MGGCPASCGGRNLVLQWHLASEAKSLRGGMGCSGRAPPEGHKNYSSVKEHAKDIRDMFLDSALATSRASALGRRQA